jgi:hypothetical protein
MPNRVGLSAQEDGALHAWFFAASRKMAEQSSLGTFRLITLLLATRYPS